jgi:predicted transcriptional regulator of viral defense system
VKSENELSRAVSLIDNLVASGIHHFTSREAQASLGISPSAARNALSRLSRKSFVASPARGFYVIVPPEYRRLGCLPADQFVPTLFEHLGLRYYVGLLSAAQYYGAAHHRPQEFQVVVARNRRRITCGEIRVAFFARKRIAEVPVERFNTPRGTVLVSTVEATAVDLVGYANHVGGFDQVATVLAELAGQIDSARLVAAAETAPLSWAQRLGYLLERVGADAKTGELKAYVQGAVRDFTPLLARASHTGASRSPDWKLLVNATVEPDL